jgi:hypothetical protein
VLREHRRKHLELRLALGLGRPEPDALVFCHADGSPMSPDNLSRDRARACNSLGLRRVMFHALRHTHVSALIAAGVDVVQISRRRGQAAGECRGEGEPELDRRLAKSGPMKLRFHGPARDGAMHRVDIIEGTLGKAYGCFGGYIAGSANLIDAVRSSAHGFVFTTTLPPAISAAATAAIRHLKASEWERQRLQDRAGRLKVKLRSAGLPIISTAAHIVPVVIGDPQKCRSASDLLRTRHGIYIQPINYPTVPRGTERLRIAPTPLHGDGLIDHLTEALLDVWRELNLPLSSDRLTRAAVANEALVQMDALS